MASGIFFNTADSFYSIDCGDSDFLGGLDRCYYWTPPETGNYEINTFDSGYEDTILYVYDQDFNEMDCNDDTFDISTGDDYHSRIDVNFSVGQTYIIVADEYEPMGSLSWHQINIYNCHSFWHQPGKVDYDAFTSQKYGDDWDSYEADDFEITAADQRDNVKSCG